jgi:hypothetical protein
VKFDLGEDDQKLLQFVFSDEGRLAFKSICNATITMFHEMDINKDGEITCDEIQALLLLAVQVDEGALLVHPKEEAECKKEKEE